MASRRVGLVEAAPRRMGVNARLDAIAAVIDWAPMDALAAGAHPKAGGRPPYPPGPMLRALFLQMLYGLSDRGLEEALLDRVSFRRFCGFGLDEATPDHSTIFRFRVAAAERGVMQACFDEVLRQLDARGLVLRRGTLVDATILAAASRRPGFKAGAGAGVAREPGTAWVRKNKRSQFGYRLHVGADQGSNLIRQVRFTPANVGESPVARSLISGDEGAIYADKGYENTARRRRLRAAGIKDRICHHSHKNQDGLPHWQARRNQGIARRRAPVEQVFGTAKRVFGYVRARSCSFIANLGQALCFATTWNLRRAAGILAASGRTARPVAA